MEYTFSWGAFGIGLIIMVVSAAVVVGYRWIADNFGGGAGSYDRYRLWGLIGTLLGFIVMLNLHNLILGLLLGSFFD